MNKTVKSLAHKVANGTAERAEVRGFKEAVGLLGWMGIKGGGVVNHYSDERVKSWAALAADLLTEAQEVLDETPSTEAAPVTITQTEGRALRPEPEADVQVTYFYITRTPTVPLSDLTSVDAYVQEEIPGIHEGLCESQASLECSEEDPGAGFLRILPESMLPGQERTQLIQCLPCYEASAEAYVRKLHRAS